MQAEGASAMLLSLKAGEPVTLQSPKTLARATMVTTPGRFPFEIIQHLSYGVIAVHEDMVTEAIKLLWHSEGIKSEGIGALSLAGLLERGDILAEHNDIILDISGSNVDDQTFAQLLQEPLSRQADGI